jgi:glc operon protein GlcG
LTLASEVVNKGVSIGEVSQSHRRRSRLGPETVKDAQRASAPRNLRLAGGSRGHRTSYRLSMLTKSQLSLEDAKAAAAAAAAVARENGWTVVIAILDDGGHLQYLERMDEVQLGSVVVAQEKARTALLFKRPTKAIENAVLGGRTVMMGLPGATPIEGGLPLINQGKIIGAVGVSGVLSSQDGIVAKAAADMIEAL